MRAITFTNYVERFMKQWILTIAIVLACSETVFATRPPQTGKMPEHLRPAMERIRKSYQEGYWAERMRARAELRSTLANTPAHLRAKMAAMMVADTAFVPVLLGSYSDVSFKYSASEFSKILFTGPHSTGTLTEYYTEISYGQFYMTGDILGWYAMPRDFNYYVHDGGDRNAGLEYGGPDFVIDVIVVADETVDFSKYVRSTDASYAYVPQIMVVHTGSDAATGADNIWSHRWNIRWRLNQRKTNPGEAIIDPTRVLSNGMYKTNDMYEGKPVVIIGDYAIQPEMEGQSNTNGPLVEIGVFAHEFGHVLGLPDLYDTDYTSEGLGNWCLMAAGSYGGDGRSPEYPSHMSAWCKETLGWITPTVVSSYMKQKEISSTTQNPEIYKLNYRNTPGGQYWLVENRQKTGFDRNLATSGLLIFHIDPTGIQSNENHPRVDLEQADGRRDLNNGRNRGDDGDPYPGSANNRNFDGFTTPDSRNYALQQSYVGVRKISSSGSVMKADLDVGTRAYVNILGAALKEGALGNGNSRIDAGETGDVVVQLSNVYPVAASDAQVIVVSQDSDVTVSPTPQSVNIGALENGEFTLSGAISLSEQTISRTTSIGIAVVTPEDTVSSTFEVVFGYPKYLIADLDSIPSENAVRFYRNALDQKQIPFEVVRQATAFPAEHALSERDVVIWFSGRRKSYTIPDSLADSLKAFLLRGGKAFLSGQNIARDLKQRNSPLQTEVLRASYSKNVAFGRTVYGIGSDDIIGAHIQKVTVAGGDGASNQVSPDELAVDTMIAKPSFRWNNQSTGGYAGVWWQEPSAGTKVVFWAFGFEAISDSAAGSNTRSEALTAVLNWFSGVSATPEREYPVTASAFELIGNYPNPFNPSTVIEFTLPAKAVTKLSIYNLMGQEIAVLVNETVEKGRHMVRFNAEGFASGTYFSVLKSGGNLQTKKMILLK